MVVTHEALARAVTKLASRQRPRETLDLAILREILQWYQLCVTVRFGRSLRSLYVAREILAAMPPGRTWEARSAKVQRAYGTKLDLLLTPEQRRVYSKHVKETPQ
jgi:hypothetical protein